MDLRIGGLGQLSPLEESSAEVSRDSGVVSQSESTLSMVSEGLSSGTVSQSQSFSAAVSQPEQGDEDEQLLLLQQTAQNYSSYIRASATEEVRAYFKKQKKTGFTALQLCESFFTFLFKTLCNARDSRHFKLERGSEILWIHSSYVSNKESRVSLLNNIQLNKPI